MFFKCKGERKCMWVKRRVIEFSAERYFSRERKLSEHSIRQKCFCKDGYRQIEITRATVAKLIYYLKEVWRLSEHSEWRKYFCKDGYRLTEITLATVTNLINCLKELWMRIIQEHDLEMNNC